MSTTSPRGSRRTARSSATARPSWSNSPRPSSRGENDQRRRRQAAAQPMFDAPGGSASTPSSLPAPTSLCSSENFAPPFRSVAYVDGGRGIARRIAYLTREQPWPAEAAAGLMRVHSRRRARRSPAPSRVSASAKSDALDRYCELFAMALRGERKLKAPASESLSLGLRPHLQIRDRAPSRRGPLSRVHRHPADKGHFPQRALLRRQRPQADHRLVLERLSLHGPAPERDRGDGKGAARSRRRIRRHPQHQRQHPLSHRARGRACRACTARKAALLFTSRLCLERGGAVDARQAASGVRDLLGRTQPRVDDRRDQELAAARSACSATTISSISRSCLLPRTPRRPS